MKKQRNVKNKYQIMYFIILITIIGMLTCLSIQYHGPNLATDIFPEPISFEEGWTTAGDTPVLLNHLTDLEQAEPYHAFSIYNTLPDTLPKGTAFCFRSKNIFYQVYVDGILVYEPYMSDSIIYNDTIGTRWNFIPLSAEDAGKTIELRITTVYDSSRTGLSNSSLSNPGHYILEIIQSKLVAVITCILILFVGIILIILDIPINLQTDKNHELLYLGLFAVSISIWCLTETNILQLFIGDSAMLSVLSCCSLMLISIPMVLYLDSAFGFRHQFVVPFISILSFTGFVVCMALHFLKIADFHDTLRITHIILGISAVLLFYTIIRSSLIKGKSQSRNLYRALRGIGLCSISIATGIDILRFYLGNSGDSALFVRIGLLIFIICYGTSSLEKTINAVKLGIQTEFVSQLAYHDGLTGIGNRTSFQEHMVSLENQKQELSPISIVVFDVNDLKFINDYFGHPAGDRMLIQSADFIQQAFTPQQGDCYRIGGDEFSVLISGNQAKERCEQGIKQFQQLVTEYNENSDKPFPIRIAYGYSVYDHASAEKKLMEVFKEADTSMYLNKKWIKKNLGSLENHFINTTTKLSHEG